MNNYRFQILLEEYVDGRLSRAEAVELLKLMDDPAINAQLEEVLDHQLETHLYDQEVELPVIRQRIVENLEFAISKKR